ncbi:hypothetical protein L218DRAFT_1007917 [Marasmius fiardii PR-910]|nr:hypothetical protein L218DRAFT_1007917 [Marasmius fiardii PR-910]
MGSIEGDGGQLPISSIIHSLPSEILTMIFKFFCEKNVLSREQLPAAVRLSMVCGRWRDIANSTPSLWPSISIDFKAWTKDFHVLNQLTEYFMERSNHSPLQLEIKFPETSFDPESDMAPARPAMTALVQNCSHWASVSLGVFCTFPPFNILAPIRGHLPSLRSLSLYRLGDIVDMVGSSTTIFDTCPSLRCLAIEVPVMGHLEELDLPRTQIKELDLLDSYSNWAIEFLSRCPEVEQLSFSNVGDVAEGEEDYDGHVISDKVKSAIIRAEEQCEVDGILRHSAFSKLTSLTISGESACLTEKWPTWDGTHLEAFILAIIVHCNYIAVKVHADDRCSGALPTEIATYNREPPDRRVPPS